MQEPSQDIVCPKCGYDLSDVAEFRCPECGFRYDEKAIRSLARSGVTDAILRSQTIVVRLAVAMAFVAVMWISHLHLRPKPACILIVATFVLVSRLHEWTEEIGGGDSLWLRMIGWTIFAGAGMLLQFAPMWSLAVASLIAASAWWIFLRSLRRTGFFGLSSSRDARARATYWHVVAEVGLLAVSAIIIFSWL